MLGRRGSRSGLAFSRSSTLTYSAVARVSRLVFTHELWTPSPHARTPPPLGITHLVDELVVQHTRHLGPRAPARSVSCLVRLAGPCLIQPGESGGHYSWGTPPESS